MSAARFGQLVAAVALSVAITAICSLLFNGTIRADMLVTGIVAAFVVNQVIDAVVFRLRKRNQALEAEMAARTAELQAARAAASLAHEVKNPLSAVLGNVELAEEILADPAPDLADARDALRSALLAARHIGALVADLAPLAGTRDETLEAVDLAEATRTAARLAQPRVQEVGRVELALDGLPNVVASPGRLVQVLLNLVVNAALASRPGVENVVRSIVLAAGGRVDVTSVPGEGTTVHLWLRVAPAKG